MNSLTHAANEKYRKLGFEIGKGCRIWGAIDKNCVCVSMGSYSTLGSGSYIATHCPVRGISVDKLRTVIEKDVWIGYRSSITPGTYIGRRCIVGMASVVSGELSKDSIYVGNPVRRIRLRNPIETVKTRLYTMQNLTCIPNHRPMWNLTRDIIVDVFEDLLDDGLDIEDLDFLYNGEFCYDILHKGIKLEDNIYDTIFMLKRMYKK